MKPLNGPPSRDESERGAEELEELRGRIDAIDQRLIRLLAERQEVVDAVVAIKKRLNLPVYHPAREEDLLSSRRHQAAEAGFDPEHIEQLFRSIVRYSRVSQTDQIARTGVRPGAAVLIVGGAGSMGRYFCQWFTTAGYGVRVLDRNDWPRVDVLCAEADLALVSVPIEVTEAVIRQLGPYLPDHCILADVTSLKVGPLAAMLDAHRGPVVGLHPIFGPSTRSMDKQLVVVTPGRDHEACQWVIDQFSAWGNVIVQADAREHDESMAIVQALRHFATFAFGRFLYRQRVDLHRTLDYSSPIYRLELGMVGRLFAQDPALYASIIFASPRRRQLLKQYVDSLTECRPLIDEGGTEAFGAEFREIAGWFGSFGDQAMRESSYLIDKLIERF